MSNVPAKNSPAVKAVPKAVKTPRKPKAPAMPLPMKFELLNFVKNADPSIPDSTLAQLAGQHIGRVVQQQTVSEYRKQFGIANVRKLSANQLAAYVEVLKDQLRLAGVVPAERPQEAANQSQAPAGAAQGQQAA